MADQWHHMRISFITMNIKVTMILNQHIFKIYVREMKKRMRSRLRTMTQPFALSKHMQGNHLVHHTIASFQIYAIRMESPWMLCQTQVDTKGNKITSIARRAMAITLVIAMDIAMVIVMGIVIMILVTQAVARITTPMNLRIMALPLKVIQGHHLSRVRKTSLIQLTLISIIPWNKWTRGIQCRTIPHHIIQLLIIKLIRLHTIRYLTTLKLIELRKHIISLMKWLTIAEKIHMICFLRKTWMHLIMSLILDINDLLRIHESNLDRGRDKDLMSPFLKKVLLIVN